MATKPFAAATAAITAIALASLTPSFVPTAHAESTAPASARFIVTKSDRITTQSVNSVASTAAKQVQASVRDTRTMGTGQQAVALDRKLSPQESARYMEELRKDPSVTNVEVDLLMQPTWTPNDPSLSKQWHYQNLNASSAWDLSRGRGVTVAVIDTGITAHPDLDANILSGYDFITEPSISRDNDGRDANPADEGDWVDVGDKDCGKSRFRPSSFHGTHVTGTIAAVTGNGRDVAGVAPEAKIVPVRALGKCGGYLSDISDAIIWASGGSVPGIPGNTNKVDVINMSLGGSGACSSSYQSAIDLANKNGVSVIVAAGNDTMDTSSVTPANCKNVTVVGASGKTDKTSSYSNYGAEVDVTAPGGDDYDDVISTHNAGPREPSRAQVAGMQGTSMATPHVAGVAALMKSVNRSLTPAQIEAILKSTTRSMTCTHTGGCGTGLVDATAAVAKAKGGSGPIPTTTPTTKPTSTPTTKPTTVPGGALRNGGFEDGISPWTGDAAKVIGTTPFKANTGSYKALFGNQGRRNTQTISQSVKVPSSGNALTFFVGVASDETTTMSKYDTFTVQVNGRTLGTFTNLDKGEKYRQFRYSLSEFAGQTVTLTFTSNEDSTGKTAFLLDDVQIG